MKTKTDPMKILMVCLGNICRSPLAEGILRHKIQEKGLDWEVDSAGTGGWHVGKKPDLRSIAVAQTHGLDISSQRARQFRASDLDDFDFIFAMDASNYQDILARASNDEQVAKVELIMNMSQPGMNATVPDPYWNDDGFERVYQMLDAACDGILEQWQG